MAKLTEVAEHLDLSTTRIHGLVKAGILPKSGRAAYDLDACRVAYIRYIREIAAGRGSKDGAVDLVAERARLTKAQAEKVERENKIADGLYMEVAAVHRAVTGSFARVRTKLLVLPSKLASLVAVTTPAKAQGLLRADIHMALDELATPPAGQWDMKNCIWTDDPEDERTEHEQSR